MVRAIAMGVVGVVGIVGVAACGGGGGATDAPVSDARADARPIDAMELIDAGAPPVTEAPDCGGDALVARQGDVALAVSALSIVELGESFDLDGDGDPDNKFAAVDSLSQSEVDAGLADGTYVVPIEIFDRDADPDGCVKLALYAGSCAVASCDMTDGVPDTVALDPSWYDAGGVPIARMRALSTDAGGALDTAGAGYLLLPLPITAEVPLLLPITVQVIEGVLSGTALTDFKFGGTMQSFRLDLVPMPIVRELGVMPGDTLLDGVFANLLGPLLAMPQSPFMTGCRTADIDLDGDGLESFCDSDPDDAVKRVDTCIDGDGTIVLDGPGGDPRCTDATVAGIPQFPDGISIAITLTASPAVIAP